jgi:acyl-CoA hydrolase
MQNPITYQSPAEAMKLVRSGDRLFVHGSACTPTLMLEHLAQRKDELKDVELVFISTYGDIYVDKPEYAGHFHINCMFVSASIREAVNNGRADFIPVFLSEIPELFSYRILNLDGALIQVSPPDKHG